MQLKHCWSSCDVVVVVVVVVVVRHVTVVPRISQEDCSWPPYTSLFASLIKQADLFSLTEEIQVQQGPTEAPLGPD